MPQTCQTSPPIARRTQILDHAIGMIGERGYGGLTIHALAARCGLSNPGLLHHFPSKQHVLIEVLHELERREAKVFAPMLHATRHAASPLARHQATVEMLRAMVARCCARPEILRILIGLHSESLNPAHPAHDWCSKRETDVLAVFACLLEPLADAPASLARRLLALMDGLGLQWLRAGQTFDLVAEWDRAIARFMPPPASEPRRHTP